MNNSSNTNKLVVPGAKQAIERMKYEIATTSRANGSVGGEITKRLVKLGQNQLSGSYQNK